MYRAGATTDSTDTYLQETTIFCVQYRTHVIQQWNILFVQLILVES